MCGICGFVGARGTADELTRAVTRMSEPIRHRGPDSAGVYTEVESGLALGHRRLSIVDLSPEGCQPMASATGRWVISYNGEIYNFERIRRELQQSSAAGWRGHSDTEVMLAAVERWGVRGALERFNGMFAFALWDRQERTLHLSRDRLGEKPLYYGWIGESFAFASELKAFRAHPEWTGAVDRGALALYLRFGYVPAPYSIWQGVAKLPAGSMLTLRWGTEAERPRPTIEPYWSARDVAQSARRDPLRVSDDEAVEALDALLRDAVGLRMQADVPLGAFLSGGVDSSTVVALMQAQAERPVRTFAIGFEEAGFNEAPHARAVARHLGTDHTELVLDWATAMDVVPRLPSMYDEPFADPSQIPTFLVAQLARGHVTVALSGDGGDELFAGYRRHTRAHQLWQVLGRVPYPVRRLASRGVARLPAGVWGRVFGVGTASRLKHGARAAADYLAARDRFALYYRIASTWSDPSALALETSEPVPPVAVAALREGFDHFTDEMTFLDLVSYLPDDILVKVDRASMAVSLEGRMPFLDHRVVELAWRLPLRLKVRDGQGKWILRRVLDRYVPRALVERPKMGFGVPIDGWLRGPLRDWAEALLDERVLRDGGYLAPEPVRRAWRDHLAGTANNGQPLWVVLMFQAWLQSVGPTPAPV